MIRLLSYCIGYAFLVFFAFFISCKKDVGECPRCPKVYSVIPNIGFHGDTVLIVGKYLLPDYEFNDSLHVKFNGEIIADEFILDSYADSIRVIIPKGITSGPVTVDLNIKDGLVGTESADFFYLLTSIVTTYAGTGFPGNTNDTIDPLYATFYQPGPLAVDPVTGNLYVISRDDINPGSVLFRRINKSGSTETLMSTPYDLSFITCDNSGQLYVSIGIGNVSSIAKLVFNGSNWTLANFVGDDNSSGHVDGNGINARFSNITGFAFDQNNNMVVSENYYIRFVAPSGDVTTIAGTGSSGYDEGPALTATFNSASGIVIEDNGVIYISDRVNHGIRKLDLNNNVSTLVGNGVNGFSNGSLSTSFMSFPKAIVTNKEGKLFVLEGSKECVRQISLFESRISVFAGNSNGTVTGYEDGLLLDAKFNTPTHLSYDYKNKLLFISDQNNNVIRQINFE